jgi:proteasome accessory factor B
MAKQDYVLRHNTIITFLRKRHYPSFEAILQHLKHQGEMLGEQDVYAISQRTFQRDIDAIRELYDLEITFSRKKKGYFINEEDVEKTLRESSLYAHERLRILRITGNMAPYFIPEKRNAKGNEYLLEISLAIKSKLRIQFNYQKFNESEASLRYLEPYVLKEFKNRWYVLGRDDKSGEIKTFGLDRIEGLVKGPERFRYQEATDIADRYQYCFGILLPKEGDAIENIELWVSDLHYNYLRTMPLHFTQKQMECDTDGAIISLQLYVTYDLIMELLSMGSDVKVLNPPHLAEKMKVYFAECAALYEN